MKLLVKQSTLYRILQVIAVLGILVSGYAIYQHFSVGTSFCNLNERFNCDTVNRGVYSEILGVPVALIGALGYFWLLILAWELEKRPRAIIRNLYAASIIGALAFTIYLAWVSNTKIGVWCPTCLISYIITAAITLTFVATSLCKKQDE